MPSTALSMLDVLFRYSDLNPFDYWPDKYSQTMSIHCGLPPDMVMYLLQHKAYGQTGIGNLYEFTGDMLRDGRFRTEAAWRGLSLLLEDYERIATGPGALFYYNTSRCLLQELVRFWIYAENAGDVESTFENKLLKFGLVLKLTNDLRRENPRGTILDAIVLWNHGSKELISACVRRWLELLIFHGINLRAYGQYEQQRHPGGLVGPPAFIRCCRVIHVDFAFGDSDDDLTIYIRNERNPIFSHLDPAYICEEGRRRADCLSKIDDAWIRDGKPLSSMPGSWVGNLKPNSELTLVCTVQAGWIYVDDVTERDILWNERCEDLWGNDWEESDYGGSDSGDGDDIDDEEEQEEEEDVEEDVEEECLPLRKFQGKVAVSSLSNG